MSQQMSLERMVADWMVDETAGGLPEHVFDQIVTTTSRRRPLPRWLAVLREPEMRAQSQVAVGVPRRPLILIGVALLLAVAIAIGVGAATLLRPQPSTDVWPGFRGDASRAGLGVTGPVGNPVVRWTFPATGSVSSNIAVAGDLVLAPSDDGLLHALGIEDGRERWSFAGAEPMQGPLAIGDRAWVADGAGVVHAMTLPDGKSLWDSTSPYPAPSDLTVMDDRLYLGTAMARSWPWTPRPAGRSGARRSARPRSMRRRPRTARSSLRPMPATPRRSTRRPARSAGRRM